jgi:CubicO group peptidase (beta-lactamase class C family)
MTRAVEIDEQKINAIFREVDQCRLPGAAVGIAVGGRPVYRQGFGLASMELPVILAPTMRMRIASMTKQFTALAYLLLCEEGKAGIDDPIGQYLPELHPVARNVTARQLLGHVSGLRDSHDITHTFNGTGLPITSAQLLSLYRDIDDVSFAPGTAWSYNNGGYLMLSAAIERMTGQSFDEVLRQRIFEPVGMHDTQLRRWDTDFLPNSATLHMTKEGGGFERSYIGVEDMGEGGMVSTVDDMLRWLVHMDAPIVGSATTWQAMKAPLSLSNGIATGYGFGLITSEYRGVETLSHAGGLMGCNSHMLKVPAAGLDVVIMVNRHDVLGMSLTYRILDACLPGLDDVEAELQGPCATGIFQSAKTGRVIQLYAKEGKQMVVLQGAESQYVSDAEGVLHPIPEYRFFKYAVTLLGDRARPSSIRFSDFGSVDELAPLAPCRNADGSWIAGAYRSGTTGAQITISNDGDRPQMTSVGRYGSVRFSLECLAEGVWKAKAMNALAWAGILSFERDGAGFRFSTGRTPALKFRRDA